MKRLEAAVFLLLLAAYTLTYSGVFHSDDEMSVAAAAQTLVTQGSMAIDQLRWNQDLAGGIGKYGLDGHLYSKYGWGASVVLAPLFVLAQVLPALGSTQAANLLNILVTALTALLVMRAARRLGASEGAAAGMALLFGLCTLAWPYAKYLFGEPLTGLAFAGAFYALLVYRDERRLSQVLAAGAWLAMGVAVKTANAAAVPVFALQLALYEWRAAGAEDLPVYLKRLVGRGLVLGVPVLLAGIVALAYNFDRFGGLLDAGYLPIEQFSGRLNEGILGLLLSPGRGLIFYVPLVWLLIPAFPLFWRRWRAEAIVLAVLGVSQTLLYARWHVWFGGWCWGPRFLVPLMPFIALALGPWLEKVWAAPDSRRARWGIVAVAGLSAAVQVLGLTVDYNLYLRGLLVRFPELQAGVAYMTVDDPAFSPLLGQLQLLAPANWDFAWLRSGGGGWWADWRILASALAFVAVSATLFSRKARPAVWRGLAVAAVAVGVMAMWQAAAWGSGADRYGPAAAQYETVFRDIGSQARPGDALLFVAPERSTILLNLDKVHMPAYAPLQERWPLTATGDAMLRGLAGAGGRLWLVTEDPPGPGSGYEHWLALAAHPLARQQTGAVLVSLYAFPQPGAAVSPAERVDEIFGGAIRLQGYTVSPWPARPGQAVLVTLYWQAEAPLTHDLSMSLRLAGSTGAQVYQGDGQPAAGYAPTSGWAPGQTVVDRRGLVLPADAAPGAYTFSLLVYDAASGHVLTLEDGQQAFTFGLLVER